MERAVGFRRGSFPAALIVPADGRAAAGPPAPRSWDLCHFPGYWFPGYLGLSRPVYGVPGRGITEHSSPPGAPARAIVRPSGPEAEPQGAPDGVCRSRPAPGAPAAG